MRRLISLLVFMLVATACSTDQRVTVDSAAGSARPSEAVEADPVDDDTSEIPEFETGPTTTTTSKPIPTTTTSAPAAIAVENPVDTRLEPSDVLFTEDALDAPWEFQHRTLDSLTFEGGPQQSNCADFWHIDQISGQAMARALWWRDGANLDHSVVSFNQAGEAERVIEAAGRAARECPVISWGEGGDYLLSPAEFEVDSADGVRTAALLIDEGFDQMTWMVFSQRENLVSILRVPTWSPLQGKPVEVNDVIVAASLAANRLGTAGLEQKRPVPTTTTTAPPPPKTTPTTTAVPPTTKLPAPATTVPTTTEPTGGGLEGEVAIPPVDPRPEVDLPADLVALLLDEEDLSGQWVVSDTDSYLHNPTRAEDLEECPALAAFDALDEVLMVERDFDLQDLDNAVQIIGRAPDSATAQTLALNFELVEPCFQRLLSGESDGIGDEDPLANAISISIKPVEIENADAATLMDIAIFEEHSFAVVMAVGDILTVVTVEQDEFRRSEDPSFAPLAFAETAARKIADAS